LRCSSFLDGGLVDDNTDFEPFGSDTLGHCLRETEQLTMSRDFSRKKQTNFKHKKTKKNVL